MEGGSAGGGGGGFVLGGGGGAGRSPLVPGAALSGSPHREPPIPWDVYNSACDLDRDGDVDIDDLGTAGRNYGNVMG